MSFVEIFIERRPVSTYRTIEYTYFFARAEIKLMTISKTIVVSFLELSYSCWKQKTRHKTHRKRKCADTIRTVLVPVPFWAGHFQC